MSYQFSSHLTRVQVDLSPTAYALGWRCEPLPSDRRPGTEAKCQPVQIVRTPDRADIAFDLIIPGFPEVPPGEGMPEMYQCCRPQAIQAIIVGWPDRLITEGPCRYELLCEATSPPGMPPKPDFCALFYAPPVRYRCESQLTDLGFCLFSVDR
ncbi:hypothetical protein E5Q_05626 [Mixia osmundae IAM 14324]|uniref:Uncharacterized protein n=1 Tax=Mixia osmundae (strain CBS 9802 / IAM 14324 / JCM 22182 / KY 12970) TaxID=764103 RepID=G7E7X8_MIXOS|nr:hypothetical protein E5Q_05626 [Mixia osmundae IAM 14324]